jgi:hypothetical protein
MDRATFLALVAFLVLAMSTTASTQPVPPGNEWSHGTTLNAFVGMASASSNSGPLAGGAAGWEITPRFGLEGSVAWLDRPTSASAFAADLTAHVSPLRPRTAVPFLKGGVGLYRTSFDSSRDVMPGFYSRRMAALGSAFRTRHAFTDPSFVVGAGVNVFPTRHFAMRPEIEAIIVMRSSQTYVVTTVTMHVAYHFEDHPVSPQVGRSSTTGR